MKKAIGICKGAIALFAISVLIGPIMVLAASAPDLGTSSSYAVFGKAGVTNNSNVGTTHIWGNVGADLLTSITNLNDATQVDGTIIAPAAGIATAASAAYDSLAAQGSPTPLDLAGTHTVTPGVYTVGATTLNGTLTLDGAGVYIFRSSSSISTTGGKMNLINGASPCNVFWQIPASMTIGTGSQVEGTIIAQTGLVSLATGATLKGRAFSLISQVTLDSNQITEPICVAPIITPVPIVTPPVVVPVIAPVVTPVVTSVATVATSTPTSTPIPVLISAPAPIVPALPNTGFPDSASTPWGIIALSGIIILALISSVLVLKKRA